MAELDVYEGVQNVDLGDQILKLQEYNEKLLRHIQQLEVDIQKLTNELIAMKKIQNNLACNISELHKTAKAEIERKDRTIADLRRQLDDLLFKRSSKASVKRPLDDNSSTYEVKRTKMYKSETDNGKERQKKQNDDRSKNDYGERSHNRKGHDRHRSRSGSRSNYTQRRRSRSRSRHRDRRESDKNHRKSESQRSKSKGKSREKPERDTKLVKEEVNVESRNDTKVDAAASCDQPSVSGSDLTTETKHGPETTKHINDISNTCDNEVKPHETKLQAGEGLTNDVRKENVNADPICLEARPDDISNNATTVNGNKHLGTNVDNKDNDVTKWNSHNSKDVTCDEIKTVLMNVDITKGNETALEIVCHRSETTCDTSIETSVTTTPINNPASKIQSRNSSGRRRRCIISIDD